MKQLLSFALLAAMLVGCNPQEYGQTPSLAPEVENSTSEEVGQIEPSGEQINAVKSEMAELGEGRWTEYSAMWSPEAGIFILSATANPSADPAEIKGYCRILDDIASRHLSDVKVSSAVFFQSGAKIECK